jgi:hypothetical protein
MTKSHGLRADSMHPDISDIIKRGKDNIIKTHGEIRRCLCRLISTYKIVWFVDFI